MAVISISCPSFCCFGVDNRNVAIAAGYYYGLYLFRKVVSKVTDTVIQVVFPAQIKKIGE